MPEMALDLKKVQSSEFAQSVSLHIHDDSYGPRLLHPLTGSCGFLLIMRMSYMPAAL